MKAGDPARETLINQLTFTPVRGEGMAEPLSEVLISGKILRLFHSGPTLWLVREAREKRWLIQEGVPHAIVWTVCELESLPWEGPLTLEAVARAFASSRDGG